MNGFKYHIIMNATLSKGKINGNTEYATVYFNSSIKTIINLNFEHSINRCFEEILYKIDNWINEGSGWLIDSVNSEYVNISKYFPLLGSSYIEFPKELKHPKKGLINIQNNDNRCFLWCHVRHLNLVSDHSTRIHREDRILADTLDCTDIEFPVSEEDYSKIEDKFDININVFSYDGHNIYPVYVSDKNFNDYMDLLLIFSGDRPHYVYIKDCDRLMFNKTKNKNKKHFCRHCLQCFSIENCLIKHKKNCLVINGKQSVELNEGSISFKNYSIQIHASFKIYADFECILKETDTLESDFIDKGSSYTKKYQKHVPCGFGYKMVCADDRFSNRY